MLFSRDLEISLDNKSCDEASVYLKDPVFRLLGVFRTSYFNYVF